MVDCKPKIKAVADIKKNRLYLTIAGNIDSKYLEKLYTDIRFCVADLKKGFDVISNVSQCNMLYISSFLVYKKIIDFLIANKVGEVVRITRNGNISYKQLINFSEKIQCYKTIHANDETDADEKLNNLVKRNGIRFKVGKVAMEYTHASEIGYGEVLDISTSGCAVYAPTRVLPVQAEIVMRLKFDQHEDLQSDLSVKAKIVRVADDFFAAHFYDFDDLNQEQLYQRLAYEVRQNTLLFYRPGPAAGAGPAAIPQNPA